MPQILEEPSLRRAFRIQRIVIGALLLRELQTRFGRKNLGAVWLFLEPMILGGCVGAFHLVLGHGLPGGINVFAFYVVGYTPYYLFRGMLNRAASALEANHALLYHSRVTLLDVVIARNLLEGAAVLLAMTVFLIAIGVLMGDWPQDPILIAAGVAWMVAMCHGASMLILAGTRWGVMTMDRLVHPFTYLTIPVTGAFFMVDWFPSHVQPLLTIFPTVHVFEMVRAGQFGPSLNYHYDLVYMAAVTVALNVLGMLALRAARKHLEI
ncbi:MAG: ABC transporter permease [Acetobacteraceae bacterium]|nr:ABC transporter permease [Acetobacteraceae bacterium]